MNNDFEVSNMPDDIYLNMLGFGKSKTPKPVKVAKPVKPAKPVLTPEQKTARNQAIINTATQLAGAGAAIGASVSPLLKKNKPASTTIDNTPAPADDSGSGVPNAPDDKIMGMSKMVFYTVAGLLAAGGLYFTYVKFIKK